VGAVSISDVLNGSIGGRGVCKDFHPERAVGRMTRNVSNIKGFIVGYSPVRLKWVWSDSDLIDTGACRSTPEELLKEYGGRA
jgi:hypothetical protein